MDFLRTKDMETLMATRAGPDFNPILVLCREYLAQVKAFPAIGLSNFSKVVIQRMFQNLVLGTIYYARQMQILHGMEATALLDELQDTLLFFDRDNLANSRFLFPSQQVLEVTVRAGLERYVCQKTQNPPDILQPLLGHGLQPANLIHNDFRIREFENFRGGYLYAPFAS